MPPCPKIGYPTQEEARLQLSRLVNIPGRKEKRHYLCPNCSYYHLTSELRNEAKNNKSDKPSKVIPETVNPYPLKPKSAVNPLIKELGAAKPLTPIGVTNFYFQYAYENDRKKHQKTKE